MTAKKKSVQYYKVVNTRKGHYGFFYKLGLNIDPLNIPIEDVGSCEPGAFYFVKVSELADWSAAGDSIAWITPKSKVVKDGRKFKAKSVLVTKLLPFEKALPLIKEISTSNWHEFGVDRPEKSILDDPKLSARQKLDYFEDSCEDTVSMVKVVVQNKKNKTFLKYVRKSEYSWSVDDLKLFMKEGLTEIFSGQDLRNIIYERNPVLLQKVVESNPKKFYPMFWEVI